MMWTGRGNHVQSAHRDYTPNTSEYPVGYTTRNQLVPLNKLVANLHLRRSSTQLTVVTVGDVIGIVTSLCIDRALFASLAKRLS